MVLISLSLLACGGPGEESSSNLAEAAAETSGKSDDGKEAQEISDEISDDSESPENGLDESHPWVVDGEDICESFGLYDDEHCHDFCPLVDPVCPASVYEEQELEEEALDCEWEIPFCSTGEGKIDTDQNGCADTCVEAGVECAINDDCFEGDYCSRPMGDCEATVGTCIPTPACEFDPEEWTPELVCGCDGYTHGSPCDAAYVGVNLNYEGMCEDIR
jgi:hypothetical protein